MKIIRSRAGIEALTLDELLRWLESSYPEVPRDLTHEEAVSIVWSLYAAHMGIPE